MNSSNTLQLFSAVVTALLLSTCMTSCSQPQMLPPVETHIAKAKKLQAEKQAEQSALECQEAIKAADGEEDVRLVELLNDQADLESEVSPAKVKYTVMRAEDMCDRYLASHEAEAKQEWLKECLRTYTKMAEVHRGLDAIGMAKAVYLKTMKVESKLGIKPADSKIRVEFSKMLQDRFHEGDGLKKEAKSIDAKERATFKERLFNVKPKPGQLCDAEELQALFDEARKKYDIEDTNYQTAKSLLLACLNAGKLYDRSILMLTREVEVLQAAEHAINSDDPGEDIVVRAQILMHTLFELGTAYQNSGQLHKARSIFKRQVVLAKKIKSQDVIFGLFCLAQVELDEGNPKAARVYCEQSIEEAKKIHAKRELLSALYARLATASARCDDVDKARLALKTAEDNSSKSSSALLAPAMEIATSLVRQGRYLEAMAMDRIAQGYLNAKEYPEAELDLALQIANIEEIQGDLTGAETDFRSIEKIAAKRKDITHEVSALSGIASILRNKLQYKESGNVMQKAIARANLQKNFSVSTLIELYHKDGVTRTHAGDFEQASKSLAKAVELERSVQRGNERVAMLMMQQASSLSHGKRIDEAKRILDEALQLAQKNSKKDKVLEHLYILSQAVNVCYTNHDLARAKETWKETLAYYKANQAAIQEKSLDDAYLLWLADNARLVGDLQSGQEFYDAYFVSLRQHDAVLSHTMYVRWASLLRQLGQTGKARRMEEMGEALRLKLKLPINAGK